MVWVCVVGDLLVRVGVSVLLVRIMFCIVWLILVSVIERMYSAWVSWVGELFRADATIWFIYMSVLLVSFR